MRRLGLFSGGIEIFLGAEGSADVVASVLGKGLTDVHAHEHEMRRSAPPLILVMARGRIEGALPAVVMLLEVMLAAHADGVVGWGDSEILRH